MLVKTIEDFRQLEERVIASSDKDPFESIKLVIENWQGIAGLVNRLAEENAELRYREVDYERKESRAAQNTDVG